MLSALPVVNLGNACCCLWVICGGVLGAYLDQQNDPRPITAGRGAFTGFLSGIIGSVVLPYGDIVGGAVSEDAIRVYFETEVDAGFAFVALTSEYGRRQLKARAFGSSVRSGTSLPAGRTRSGRATSSETSGSRQATSAPARTNGNSARA